MYAIKVSRQTNCKGNNTEVDNHTKIFEEIKIFLGRLDMLFECKE